MADEKTPKPRKKAFDATKLLKDIKDQAGLIPDGAEWRGARKALVIAHNQLNDAIEQNKRKK